MTVTFHVAEDGPDLNIANGNFQHLMQALDIDWEDWCGSISPEEMYEKLNRLRRGVEQNPTEFARSVQVYETPGKAMMIDCPLTVNQMHRYIYSLYAIVACAFYHNARIQFG